MKHYDQTEKAKEEYLRTSTLAAYMMGEPDRVYTRDELATQFSTSDRRIREMVAELANYIAILSPSGSKGYRVPSFNENTEIGKLVEMLDEVTHQINEFRTRCENLQARMKPLVALSVVLEKTILDRTTK